MSVEHSTFTLQRDYPQPVAAVFAAWSDQATKRRWFDLAEPRGEHHLDFREGGRETYRSAAGTRPAYAYDATYLDIVPGTRIVSASTISADGRRVSASLATVEFTATPGGTRLVLTEHGAYLDGLDTPDSRRRGTTTQLDALGGVLTSGEDGDHGHVRDHRLRGPAGL